MAQAFADDGLLGHHDGIVLGGDLERDGQEHAGPQGLVRIVEFGGQPRPCGWSGRRGDRWSRPALEDPALIGRRGGVDRLAGLEAAEEVFGDREVEADLREVVEGRDAGAGRHIGAERDRAGADAAGEGRADGQVLEPGLGGLALGLGGGDGAVERLDLGLRSSTCAPVPAPVRLSAWARSSLIATSLRSAVGAVGLGGGLLDLGAALGGVERDQHVAGLDLLALVEADLADDACHLAVTMIDS